MIEEISKSKFKEIIVSTGCTFDHEIKKTSEILKNKEFTLMHCVSIYPTPLSEVHLENNHYKFFKNVGLSEHSNLTKMD